MFKPPYTGDDGILNVSESYDHRPGLMVTRGSFSTVTKQVTGYVEVVEDTHPGGEPTRRVFELVHATRSSTVLITAPRVGTI
jgi:hypothetical protein